MAIEDFTNELWPLPQLLKKNALHISKSSPKRALEYLYYCLYYHTYLQHPPNMAVGK